MTGSGVADGPGHVAVIGAGAVGLCCGIALLRRGATVTLIDRGAPGQATSFGNAGVISRGSILPLNLPSLWRGLPRYALNRDVSVRFDPAFLPNMLPWLMRFTARARPGIVQRTSAALERLTSDCVALHEGLLAEAGRSELIRHTGYLTLFRNAADFEAAALERRRLKEAGIEYEVLSGAGLHNLEPHLAPIFSHGSWVRASASVASPGRVGEAYADVFRRLGGTVRQADVKRLEQTDQAVRITLAEGEPPLAADRAVIAAGPWSNNLTGPLGTRFPLAVERGYHAHYRIDGGAELNRPIFDKGGGYVMAPMERGIRLTTGIEFARRDSPPTPHQLAKAEVTARQVLPLGERTGDPVWLGNRPSLPDSLPVIGPAPGHDRVWLAFGHGHIGLTTAPMTGQVVAQSIFGQSTAIDLTPYAPARFA